MKTYLALVEELDGTAISSFEVKLHKDYPVPSNWKHKNSPSFLVAWRIAEARCASAFVSNPRDVHMILSEITSCKANESKDP